ncbi:MAG: hypothetical protein JW852_03390, partial [Spirochaetales bacterium]|nr:hypothetical protein [Spirochaetales bacterium]
MIAARLINTDRPLRRLIPLLGVLFALSLAAKVYCEPFEAAYALSLTAENLGFHEDIFFEENRLALSFEEDPFDLNFDFSFMGGGRYPPHTSYQMGRYFYLNDASTLVSLKNWDFYGGYLPHRDVVQTPYSIYISSLDIPVLNAGFVYTHNRFFYETRWVRLNERSSVEYIGKEDETYIDRGLTFKAFGFDFGNLTVGFENSYMYLGQVFDAESFLLPGPMFALEMILASGGRPWSQANNTNVLMGFFA